MGAHLIVIVGGIEKNAQVIRKMADLELSKVFHYVQAMQNGLSRAVIAHISHTRTLLPPAIAPTSVSPEMFV